MAAPDKFTWIEKPHLAAMARPSAPLDLVWLRSQGIQILISLTETPLCRDWVNDAGLMAVHVPVKDLMAPTPEQFEHCLGVIRRAKEQKMAVGIHCAAGLGRTGTLLAVWYIDQGLDPATAMAKVRELRPGSIETPEQERAIRAFHGSTAELKSPVIVDENPSTSAAQRMEMSFATAGNLSQSDLDVAELLEKFNELVVDGIGAAGGAIWLRNEKGNWQLRSNRNYDRVRTDRNKHGVQSHDELIRQVVQINRPMLLEPYGTSGILGSLPAGNPTDFFCLLAPIQLETECVGILEVWTAQSYNIRMQRTFLNYLVQMAGFLAIYLRRKSERDRSV